MHGIRGLDAVGRREAKHLVELARSRIWGDVKEGDTAIIELTDHVGRVVRQKASEGGLEAPVGRDPSSIKEPSSWM